MRTKEQNKIRELYHGLSALKRNTAEVFKWFLFYRKTFGELMSKTNKLYKLLIAESEGTQRATAFKRNAKSGTIKALQKLRRAVLLDLPAGKKTAMLQRTANYTFSDFNRPSEEVRIKRFYEVLTAARRIKDISQYGVTQKEYSEIEATLSDYIVKSKSPLLRKKERAWQARQCRKLLKEIRFIIYKKLKPFFEKHTGPVRD